MNFAFVVLHAPFTPGQIAFRVSVKKQKQNKTKQKQKKKTTKNRNSCLTVSYFWDKFTSLQCPPLSAFYLVWMRHKLTGTNSGNSILSTQFLCRNLQWVQRIMTRNICVKWSQLTFLLFAVAVSSVKIPCMKSMDRSQIDRDFQWSQNLNNSGNSWLFPLLRWYFPHHRVVSEETQWTTMDVFHFVFQKEGLSGNGVIYGHFKQDIEFI